MGDSGRGEEVVHRDGEESLDLAGVEVHGYHVVGARAGEQLRYQPGVGTSTSLVAILRVIQECWS